MVPERERRIVRTALALSFGTALVLGSVLAMRKGWLELALGLALALALVHALAELLARSGLPIRWLVGVALLNALTVVPELALRLADYRHGPKMEFGFPDPKTLEYFARDAELFWRHDPAAPGINSWGFRGREVVSPKPADALRVVFLGDSCSAIGQPASYPMRVEELLNAAPRADGRRYEVVNLAVPGYTSHQGLVLARKYASRLEAELAFVYFGWNDHWQAYGATDEQKVLARSSPRLEALTEKLRVLQAVRALAASFARGAGQLEEVRVPPERYAANLAAILAEFRAAGTKVVFITAPTSFYRSGVPAPLVEKGFLRRLDEGLERHRAYTELTRRVASEGGADVLDLERLYDALPELPRLFLSDGIHFTDEGRERIARDVAESVGELLPRD